MAPMKNGVQSCGGNAYLPNYQNDPAECCDYADPFSHHIVSCTSTVSTYGLAIFEIVPRRLPKTFRGARTIDSALSASYSSTFRTHNWLTSHAHAQETSIYTHCSSDAFNLRGLPMHGWTRTRTRVDLHTHSWHERCPHPTRHTYTYSRTPIHPSICTRLLST